jgi:8-oxo-dGTP pyrophosphatase MutT (NUDIX family)
MNEIVSSFISTVTQSLGKQPIDFHERNVFIREQLDRHIHYLAAGVCMPLYYNGGEFYIQLIKRSATVSQPGDLSFPGGMLSPVKDNVLKYLISSGIIPLLKNNKYLDINKRNNYDDRLIILYLSSAVREAWEEVRINPFHLVYLGSLPSYTLKMFHRVIFPSVCFLKSKSNYRLNDEVDRIIDIPLSTFLNESNYFRLCIEMPQAPGRKEAFPCLLFRESSGEEHILWGATFFLIMSFLETVYDFRIPTVPTERSIKKTLLPDYHRNL